VSYGTLRAINPDRDTADPIQVGLSLLLQGRGLRRCRWSPADLYGPLDGMDPRRAGLRFV